MKQPGQTLQDLERTLQRPGKNVKNPPVRANEGEATLYGIYYDDTEYDYMQHLRGVDESRFVGSENAATSNAPLEAVFVPAPRGGSTAVGNTGAAGRTTVAKGKGRAATQDEQDEFAEMFNKPQRSVLPESVLPSKTELTWQQAQEASRAMPSDLSGLRPDMDPHLRQVLEALDDDAFVQDNDQEEAGGHGMDDEKWINELLGGGERDEYAPELQDEFEFVEQGVEDDGRPSWTAPTAHDDQEPREETWQDRFRAFKEAGGLAARPSSPPAEQDDFEEDGMSERADTLASLPSIAPSVMGAKKRRKGAASDASGYSMSSSSMFRNKGLTVLDEMFEKASRFGI